MEDVVNHPNHYKSRKGLETIDVIEAFTEDLYGMEAVCQGHILRYICRWYKKNGLEDLKKAQFYLDKLILMEERKEDDKSCPYAQESNIFVDPPYKNPNIVPLGM